MIKKLISLLSLIMLLTLGAQVIMAACTVPEAMQGAYEKCLKDAATIDGGAMCESYKTICTTNPGSIESVFGSIRLPSQISSIPRGAEGINNLIKTGIDLIFIIGAVLATFVVLWGAIDYMSAGSRKEGAAEARKKITYALIGLALLGLSFFIIRFVGTTFGLGDFFKF